MAISKAERLAKVHTEALREFDEIQSAQQAVRRECLEDRRFYSISGGTWEGALGEQFANKPRLEMNKVHDAVIRVITEYRQNRITVDFVPKDGESFEETADVCDGLYRADEQDSCAQEAYDNAFEEAVGGGFGAWRLRTCYEDEYDDENTKQRIKIEPIVDADSSVFFDLNAKRRDKSDARKCYVLSAMTPQAYRDEYDDEPESWPKQVFETYFDWYTPDVVYVAEYYCVEEKTEVVHVFRGLDDKDMMVPDHELEEDPEKLQTLQATGFREVRQKKIKRRQVHKYILSGGKVLSDEGVIAGKCIPVVPVYGKRWFVDNVERCMGHVRLAKDAQRLANMLRSNLAEIASMSAREKPILTPEQILGHTMMWAEDNVKEYPYLLVNPVTDAQGQQVASGPVAYTKAPSVPQALAALMQVVEQDMKDLLGDQAGAEQVRSNIPDALMERVQSRLDMRSYIYMDNLAVAMKRNGEIWLSMMKDIVVEDQRKMKTVDEQGGVGSVTVNDPSYDEEAGEEVVENDISSADFDVVATVGPASSSKREATVRKLASIMPMTQDPETLSVLMSMALMNMDGEGIDDVRQWARRKMLTAGVVKPTDEEQEEMKAQAANQQQDPNSLYLLASAKKQEADARAVDAKIVQTLADAAQKGAQTEKTLAEVGQTEVSTVQTGQEVAQAAPNGNALADVLGKLAEAIGAMNRPQGQQETPAGIV